MPEEKPTPPHKDPAVVIVVGFLLVLAAIIIGSLLRGFLRH